MAYITYAEYQAARPDSTLSEDDFNILVEAASAIIDRVTMTKIELLGGIDLFSDFTQGRVQSATIAQVDTLDAQGGLSALTGFADTDSGQVTIGRYSENLGGSSKKTNGSSMQVIDGLPLSPMVNLYLQPTGLLNRAINRTYRLEDFN